uniref:Formin-J n=1 Tax=Parastrongyloides trichosuri TaxID=131310 RepID=A0A0N4ZSF6_PARTI
MASTFMKMFRSKKHNKENDVSFARNRESRCSTKSNSGWDDSKYKFEDGGVYVGDMDVTKASYAYSVPTAPKMTKGPRSCPGAPMYTIDERQSIRESKKKNRQNLYVNESYYEGKKQNKKHDNDRLNHSSIMNNSLMSHSTHNKRNHHVLNNSNLNAFNHTSEYGSAGPSPMPMYYRNEYKPSEMQTNYRYREERESLNYTDNDSTDNDDNVSYLVKHYETEIKKLKKKIKEDRKKYEIQLCKNQGDIETYKTLYEQYRKAVAREHRRYTLESDKARELKRLLSNAHSRILELELKLKTHDNIFHDKYSQINHSHTDESTAPIGAGEALCMLTDSNADILNNLAKKNNQNSKISFNDFVSFPDGQADDVCDEVKNFRLIDTESNCNYEQARDCPRTNSVLSIGIHPSPLEPYIGESVCSKIDEEYCSLAGDEIINDQRTINVAPLAQMEKFSDCVSVSKVEEEKNDEKSEEEKTESDSLENVIRQIKPQPSPLRRSFSDSDLRTRVEDDILIENLPLPSIEEFDEDCREIKPPIPPKPSHLSKCKTKAPMEMYTCSTDDEADSRALIERQLRKRGDRIKFLPPRRTINQKLYRHFGKHERKALESFEYLQDVSTDVSGMQSSPDYLSPYL